LYPQRPVTAWLIVSRGWTIEKDLFV